MDNAQLLLLITALDNGPRGEPLTNEQAVIVILVFIVLLAFASWWSNE